jgi:hypothetical protein
MGAQGGSFAMPRALKKLQASYPKNTKRRRLKESKRAGKSNGGDHHGAVPTPAPHDDQDTEAAELVMISEGCPNTFPY